MMVFPWPLFDSVQFSRVGHTAKAVPLSGARVEEERYVPVGAWTTAAEFDWQNQRNALPLSVSAYVGLLNTFRFGRGVLIFSAMELRFFYKFQQSMLECFKLFERRPLKCKLALGKLAGPKQPPQTAADASAQSYQFRRPRFPLHARTKKDD